MRKGHFVVGESYPERWEKRTVAAGRRACIVAEPMLSLLSDGLPACTACGRCCHLVVELTPLVDDGVPEHLVVEHDGVRCMDQQGNGACVALDQATQLCTIYELRPQVCRDFKRAESLCRRAVAGKRGKLAPAAVGG